ncbi:hypothetical protein [Streptomyces sp. NBC_01483]|uniref:hypothetical protein n=1 Tax=Streptomyces sp. NBC_01483 TaxID=2903883 RepID=UPI002E37EBD4|nr:hypothetical protein [Streptomyces sp. NBC_01483]
MRLTKQKVVDGSPGPDGVRIRYAVAEAAEVVTVMLKTAAGDLETGHLKALAPGQCGTWLPDGLAGADLIAPLVRAGSAGGLQSAAAASGIPTERRTLHAIK